MGGFFAQDLEQEARRWRDVVRALACRGPARACASDLGHGGETAVLGDVPNTPASTAARIRSALTNDVKSTTRVRGEAARRPRAELVALDVRQPIVHQRDVGSQARAARTARRRRSRSAADDLDPGVSGEREPQPFADDLVVVDDDDSQREGGGHGPGR